MGGGRKRRRRIRIQYKYTIAAGKCKGFLKTGNETGNAKALPVGGGLDVSKNTFLVYGMCRGGHRSPANLAQHHVFRGQFSYKANGHGRAMLAPTSVVILKLYF